jgi:hypothetical protein
MSTAARTAVAAGTALLLFPVLLIAAAAGAISGLVGGGNSGPPSQTALADIPGDYLTLYQQAAAVCPGLDWTVLAAIGKIESDHGRSTSRVSTMGRTRPAPAGHSNSFSPPGTASSTNTTSHPAAPGHPPATTRTTPSTPPPTTSATTAPGAVTFQRRCSPTTTPSNTSPTCSPKQPATTRADHDRLGGVRHRSLRR